MTDVFVGRGWEARPTEHWHSQWHPTRRIGCDKALDSNLPADGIEIVKAVLTDFEYAFDF